MPAVYCAPTAACSERHEQLDDQIPLPLRATNWLHGWVGNRPISDYFGTLQRARVEAMEALFHQQTERVTLRGAHRTTTTVPLKEYARLLVLLCCGKTPSGLRVTPLEFEWCFQAEQDPLGNGQVATMRSTLPAFEWMCVTSTVCIAHAMIGIGYANEGGAHDLAIRHFNLCIDECAQNTHTLFASVVNRGQWSRMRRQGLPLQLLPAWQKLLASKAAHRAQICKMLALAAGHGSDEAAAANGTLVALARGAEDTAATAVQSARALLLDQKFLLATQVQVVEGCYHALVEEAHRMRVQCLLQDAYHAVYTGQARFVKPLLDWCAESASVTFGHKPEPLDAERHKGVLDSIAEVRELAATTSTATDACTQEETRLWRATLPRLNYNHLPQ